MKRTRIETNWNDICYRNKL